MINPIANIKKIKTEYSIILFFSLSYLIIVNSLFAIVISPYISYKFLRVECCIFYVYEDKLTLISIAMSSQA